MTLSSPPFFQSIPFLPKLQIFLSCVPLTSCGSSKSQNKVLSVPLPTWLCLLCAPCIQNLVTRILLLTLSLGSMSTCIWYCLRARLAFFIDMFLPPAFLHRAAQRKEAQKWYTIKIIYDQEIQANKEKHVFLHENKCRCATNGQHKKMVQQKPEKNPTTSYKNTT